MHDNTEDRTILQIALDVHMTQNGSYQRTDAEQAADRKILKRKLWDWKETNSVFDEAVRTLIRAALNESAGSRPRGEELLTPEERAISDQIAAECDEVRRELWERREEVKVMDINWEAVEEQVKEGFISKQRHPSFPLTIYNYSHKAQYDWHWTPETMACRGLIRHDDGRIVSRPFPKFFSVEQLNGNLPDGPFDVFEKLDGSLGVSYFDSDGYVPYIATRGSFVSEQAGFATELLHRKYRGVRLKPEFTYLFEIIYPNNRIVVDYGGMADIFLLAVIHTATGYEYPLDQVHADLGFPMARRYDGIADFSELAAKEEPNSEGFVLRFRQCGTRVKVKFAEYKRLHKILTGLTARHIWETLQTPEGMTPILERVPDEFYQWADKTAAEIRGQFADIELQCQRDFKDLGDRKSTAEYFKTCEYPAVLFRMLDGRDYSDLIWKRIYPEASKPFREDEE